MHLPPQHEFSKPLIDRLGRQHLESVGEPIDIGTLLRSSGSTSKSVWPTPFFTRLAIDCDQSESIVDSLLESKERLGLSTVGLNGFLQDRIFSPTLSSGVEITPIYIDEPIAFAKIESAAAIEIQFYHASNAKRSRHTKATWAPLLPSDLLKVEHLADRVSLIKNVSSSTGTVCGAAIASQRPYEDVRYLIDSGFDYVCLMTDIVVGLREKQTLSLYQTELAVESALKAIRDSGRSISLLLSGHVTTESQALHYLTQGVTAIGLDHYLIHKRPHASSHPSDGFGGFLTEYAAPAAPASHWILDAVQQMNRSLADAIELAGYSSLSELLSGNR